MRVFYESDADPRHLESERVAVLGYGIQGRAQALNLRDSGVEVIVGNRDDEFREKAEEDGFAAVDLGQAAESATISILLLPDEIQPQVFEDSIAPGLNSGDGIVFAHGFALRYGLIEVPDGIDSLLLAPRMPGQYLRGRYLDGWGVPAFVSVERDSSGRAMDRLLALAQALGITRCGALEVSAAIETELDHFSEHFTYPAIFRILESAFEELVAAGYPPEAALMELHGSGEIGLVLSAASQEGLFPMLDSHASPACQVGVALNWERSLGADIEVRERIHGVIDGIRKGGFAQSLLNEQKAGYPRLRNWRTRRSSKLARTEADLKELLKKPPDR